METRPDLLPPAERDVIMCDYCDCRSIPEIAGLSGEHERVLAITHTLRSRGETSEVSIEASLAALDELLSTHTRREEAGVFAALTDIDCDPHYRRRFLDDHAEIDVLLASARRDPAAVARLVEVVERHVFEEETDLYPAIRQLFSPADWHRVDHLVDQLIDHPGEGTARGGRGSDRSAPEPRLLSTHGHAVIA